MRKKRWYGIALIGLICGGLCAGLYRMTQTANTAGAQMSEPMRTIILDPGHGGIDGGAVSKTGLVEKDINLSIARKLRELLECAGFQVIMTRDTDCSIHDPDKTTVREIKVSDIHNRMKLMERYNDAVFVSIHQNFFEQSKYSGAQFFYASAAGSQELAECFRTAIRTQLQPENTREIKLCGDSVYLIYHATTTAVLAECGFLSNPEEAAKLSSQTYQQQMAFALFSGLMQYFQSNGG